MRTHGRIFILSGPSGSGKTTLARRLLQSFQGTGRLSRSISYTTRPARAGEINGRDYYFVSQPEFDRLKRGKKLLEWTRYLGYYYATSRDFVVTELKQGRNIVLCLDYKGVRQIRREFPDQVVSIFILPPSLEELRGRIEQRSKTASSEIRGRLEMAHRELKISREYDYSIVNIDLETAARDLTELVRRTAKVTGTKRKGR